MRCRPLRSYTSCGVNDLRSEEHQDSGDNPQGVENSGEHVEHARGLVPLCGRNLVGFDVVGLVEKIQISDQCPLLRDNDEEEDSPPDHRQQYAGVDEVVLEGTIDGKEGTKSDKGNEQGPQSVGFGDRVQRLGPASR